MTFAKFHEEMIIPCAVKQEMNVPVFTRNLCQSWSETQEANGGDTGFFGGEPDLS